MINVTGLASSKNLDPAQRRRHRLMRPEFLVQGREGLPTEESKYQIYSAWLMGCGKP